MASFQEFFTKLAPVTKRLQLDPYFKDQTTSLGVYFEPIKKKKFEKIFLVNAFANGLISVLLKLCNLTLKNYNLNSNGLAQEINLTVLMQKIAGLKTRIFRRVPTTRKLHR